MNLEQLRKQAKELVRAARAGDAEALERLGGREPILARAQLVVARENGYPSWPALVAAAEANADAFVRAATENHRTRAERMLEARPEIERDPWARLVLGRGWEGDPNAPGGPRGWAPILYVCHSCFASPELARDLLERGADPNATFENEYGDMSALYGAAGVVHNPELTRILLEAGANPDDGESLYHSVETREHRVPRAPARARRDRRRVPTRSRTPWTTRRSSTSACSSRRVRTSPTPPTSHMPSDADVVPTALRLLAEHGADLDAPGGETWRGDVPLRTPYQHAVIRGRDDLAETLAELGADTTVRTEGSRPRGSRARRAVERPVPRGSRCAGSDRHGSAAGEPRRGHRGGRPGLPRVRRRARRTCRSSATRRGWAIPRSSAGCSRRVPTRRAGAPRRNTSRRSRSRRSVRSNHRAPGRDYVAVAELLAAAGQRDRAALPRGRRRAALRLAGG